MSQNQLYQITVCRYIESSNKPVILFGNGRNFWEDNDLIFESVDIKNIHKYFVSDIVHDAEYFNLGYDILSQDEIYNRN